MAEQTIDIGDRRALLAREAGGAEDGTAFLAPVARALAAWTGKPEVAFDVALRTAPRPPLDLSRTVGNPTVMQPVRVFIDPSDELGAVRAKIRACLDAPAQPGTTAAVSFAYAQALADLLGGADNFGALMEDTTAGPTLLPPYDIAIEATLNGTHLMLRCAFPAAQVEPASADAVLSLIAGQMRSFVTERDPATRAFELTTLDTDELARLVTTFGDEEDAAASAPSPDPVWR